MNASPLTMLLLRPHEKAWVTLAVIVGLVPRLYAEEAFAIRLARHKLRMGQEYLLKVEFNKTEGSSFISDSRSQQTNTTSCIELLAHCKVLADAEDSESTELVNQRLIERQATNSNALLAPGTVVITKMAAGERFYALNHDQLSLAVTKVLGQLLGSISDDTGCTPDQAFGTPEPMKIGDTWKGSPGCAITGLNKYLGITEPNQFDITMKLLGVEDTTGTKCQRLGLSMLVHTDKPAARVAKDRRSRLFDAKWDTKVHCEGISLLPVDQAVPPLRTEEKFEGVSKVSYTSGNRLAVLELRFAEQKTVEIKLLN